MGGESQVSPSSNICCHQTNRRQKFRKCCANKKRKKDDILVAVNSDLTCIFSPAAGTFALRSLIFFCGAKNGLQSDPRVDPAATGQRRRRCSRARRGGEDEVESEVDGGAAGGQTQQRLPGERAVNYCLCCESG